MFGEGIETEATSSFGRDSAFKKIKYKSEEFCAYVEIKMKAKVFDDRFDLHANKRLVEYNFYQHNIAKAHLDPPLSQGEIKLTSLSRTLGIDFDIVKTYSGYELELYWATFGDHEGYQMFHIRDKINVSIPMGLSSIKNLNGEYSVFPEPHDPERIYLSIIEANICILSLTHPYDQWLKDEFDQNFNDYTTVDIDIVYRNPRNHLGY